MGDRVSFSFKGESDRTSIAFFAHWDGEGLLGIVEEYDEELQRLFPVGKSQMYPLERRDPAVTMADFVQWYLPKTTKRTVLEGEDKHHVMSNYYLGKDGDDGDNSDNGHHVFNLITHGWED